MEKRIFGVLPHPKTLPSEIKIRNNHVNNWEMNRPVFWDAQTVVWSVLPFLEKHMISPGPFLHLPALPLSFQLLWDTPVEAKASTIHYWRNKSQSSGQSRADQLKPAPT